MHPRTHTSTSHQISDQISGFMLQMGIILCIRVGVRGLIRWLYRKARLAHLVLSRLSVASKNKYS